MVNAKTNISLYTRTNFIGFHALMKQCERSLTVFAVLYVCVYTSIKA